MGKAGRERRRRRRRGRRGRGTIEGQAHGRSRDLCERAEGLTGRKSEAPTERYQSTHGEQDYCVAREGRAWPWAATKIGTTAASPPPSTFVYTRATHTRAQPADPRNTKRKPSTLVRERGNTMRRHGFLNRFRSTRFPDEGTSPLMADFNFDSFHESSFSYHDSNTIREKFSRINFSRETRNLCKLKIFRYSLKIISLFPSVIKI